MTNGGPVLERRDTVFLDVPISKRFGKVRRTGSTRELSKSGLTPYRIASIGERRDARIAGYSPKTSASASAVAHAIRRPTGLTTSP